MEKINEFTQLSYDIIYKIYFFIDDYSTASNFWLLSKTFNKKYMSYYNKPYEHKYNILYNNLFTFLSLLPEWRYDEYYLNLDIDFYELVTTKFLLKEEKQTVINDIRFIYYFYKNFFIYDLFFESYCNNRFRGIDHFRGISYKVSRVILLKGPKFIDKITTVIFNKNKLKIVSKYNTVNTLIENHI